MLKFNGLLVTSDKGTIDVEVALNPRQRLQHFNNYYGSILC
jgi:hypothetical protein